MANIQQSLSLKNRFTPIFIKYTQQTINISINMINNIKGMNINNLFLMKNLIKDIGTGIDQSAGKQQQLNNQINNGTQGAKKFSSALKEVVGVAQAIQLGSTFVQAADMTSNTEARLNLINDEKQTTGELQDKIMKSAMDTTTKYADVANAVANIGLTAGDSFKSNDQMIAFAELMNKSFTISGLNDQDKSMAMGQVIQALGNDVIQEDELKLLKTHAPVAVQAIADTMKTTKGQLKKLAMDGKITSDILVKAMFDAQDKINEQAKQIPTTFSGAMNNLSNATLIAFTPAIDAFNTFINSNSGKAFFNGLAQSMMWLGQVIFGIITVFSMFFSFLYNNWSSIALVVAVVAVALVAYALWIAGVWIWTNMLMRKVSIMTAMGIAATWLMANWPLLLMIGILAIIIAVLIRAGVTASQVVGFIAGAFGWLYASIYNVIAGVWNSFASLAEFLVMVFNDPLYYIHKLFASIWNSIVSFVSEALGFIVSKIKEVPILSDLIGDVDISSWKVEIAEPPKNNWKAPKMEMKNIGETAISWGLAGKGFADSLGNMDWFNKIKDQKGIFDKGPLGDLNKLPEGPPSIKTANTAGGPGLGKVSMPNVGNIGTVDSVGSVGKIDEDVTISEEDLKLLKDIAGREFMLHYKQITPNVTVTTGDIRESANVDELIDKITVMTEHALASSLVTSSN